MFSLGGCSEAATDPVVPNPNNPNNPNAPKQTTALEGTLYWTADGDGEIHKLVLSTGTDTLLGRGRGADVGADGRIVFVQDHLVEGDGTLGGLRTIVETNFDDVEERSNNNFADPRISPDGTKIAYSNLQRDAFVVNRADGAVVARFEYEGATERFDHPSWTPDGRIVVAGGMGNPGLFVSDTTLANLTRFDPELDLNVAYPARPTVSPDGTKVAFMVEQQIQVVGLDGTGLTTLSGDDEATNPTWSPDGSFIAYATSAGRIKIRPAAGGDAVDVFESYPALKVQIASFGGMANQFAWVR
jgi:tricorn protease-like protein